LIYYNLKKEDNFELDILDLIEFCKNKEIKNLILINPNNPNGGYISNHDIHYLLKELSHLDNIILDESFIHFAYEDLDLSQIS
jgi:histidinol-phosphate/aromatic aminotransferase/cobyric acid decarboxylase-like protein